MHQNPHAMTFIVIINNYIWNFENDTVVLIYFDCVISLS